MSADRGLRWELTTILSALGPGERRLFENALADLADSNERPAAAVLEALVRAAGPGAGRSGRDGEGAGPT